MHYELGAALSHAFFTMQRPSFNDFLAGWRSRLRYILTFDPHGHLRREYPEIASQIPESFPEYEDVKYYLFPVTTFSGADEAVPPPTYEVDSHQPYLGLIAVLCWQHFQAGWEVVMLMMRATVWEGAIVRRMCEACNLILEQFASSRLTS